MGFSSQGKNSEDIFAPYRKELKYLEKAMKEAWERNQPEIEHARKLGDYRRADRLLELTIKLIEELKMEWECVRKQIPPFVEHRNNMIWINPVTEENVHLLVPGMEDFK